MQPSSGLPGRPGACKAEGLGRWRPQVHKGNSGQHGMGRGGIQSPTRLCAQLSEAQRGLELGRPGLRSYESQIHHLPDAHPPGICKRQTRSDTQLRRTRRCWAQLKQRKGASARSPRFQPWLGPRLSQARLLSWSPPLPRADLPAGAASRWRSQHSTLKGRVSSGEGLGPGASKRLSRGGGMWVGKGAGIQWPRASPLPELQVCCVSGGVCVSYYHQEGETRIPGCPAPPLGGLLHGPMRPRHDSADKPPPTHIRTNRAPTHAGKHARVGTPRHPTLPAHPVLLPRLIDSNILIESKSP